MPPKRKKPENSWDDSFNIDEDDLNTLNSTKKERAETIALIEKYKNTDINDLNDLKDFMLASLQGQLRTSDQIASIKHNLKNTRAAVVANSDRIEVHDNEIEQLKSANLKLQTGMNILKQKEFDNEVVLSGFPDTPNQAIVLEAIGRKFPQSFLDIKKSECWSTTRKKTKKGFMTLTFTDKSAQIKFMKAKIANGPVYLSELSQEANPANENIVIFFNNRLSKTNQDINKKIRDLIKDKKIIKSRFRNCQFEVQLDDSSEFVSVPSLEFLGNLIN